MYRSNRLVSGKMRGRGIKSRNEYWRSPPHCHSLVPNYSAKFKVLTFLANNGNEYHDSANIADNTGVPINSLYTLLHRYYHWQYLRRRKLMDHPVHFEYTISNHGRHTLKLIKQVRSETDIGLWLEEMKRDKVVSS